MADATIIIKTGVDINGVYPPLLGYFYELLNYVVSLGKTVTVNDVRRDFTTQAQRKAANNAAATPGSSTHQGVDIGQVGSQAIDITLYEPDMQWIPYGPIINGRRVFDRDSCDQLYFQLGQWWQSRPKVTVGADTFNRRWGGYFSNNFDPVHFDFSKLSSPKITSVAQSGGGAIPVASENLANSKIQTVKSEQLQIRESCK